MAEVPFRAASAFRVRGNLTILGYDALKTQLVASFVAATLPSPGVSFAKRSFQTITAPARRAGRDESRAVFEKTKPDWEAGREAPCFYAFGMGSPFDWLPLETQWPRSIELPSPRITMAPERRGGLVPNSRLPNSHVKHNRRERQLFGQGGANDSRDGE